jgi:hypothetical protein
MNTEERDDVKNHNTWNEVHEAFNREVPGQLENQLQGALNAFREDLREHPYVCRRRQRGFSLKQFLDAFSRPWFRSFLLVGMALAVVVVVGSIILGNEAPTWANVQQRFAVTPFFKISIYRRDLKLPDYNAPPQDPLAEPRFVEVWGGHGNRLRIRSGSKLTFAEKGEILKTFDLITRTEAYPDSIIYHLVNTAGRTDPFSLSNWLITENPLGPEDIPGWFPKEFSSKGKGSSKLVDTTSRVIQDPVVSEDVVVFDFGLSYYGRKYGMARIWALRKSMLPIRVVMMPMNSSEQPIPSATWDMIFSYSKEQPKEFFDPQVFAAKLKDPANSIESLIYMFHQYPAGDSTAAPES